MSLKVAGMAAVLATMLTFFVRMRPERIPEAWLVNGGSETGLYMTTIDHNHKLGKNGALLIRSEFGAFSADAFCAISQHINPVHYRGKRVRFSAMLSTENLNDNTVLFMRADTSNFMGEISASTRDQPAKGTQTWQRYDLVADVPKDAIRISFGVIQNGQGSTWIDDIHFEAVDASVHVTATNNTNAFFEDTILPVEPVL